MSETSPSCTGFVGERKIASGAIAAVAVAVKQAARDRTAAVLFFDDQSGQVIDVDLRGSRAALLQRLASRADPGTESDGAQEERRPGRPKLGVVGREVTLLPRHWEWLAAQPGGASVALRKLVEQAIRDNQDRDRIRAAQEAAYRFMSVMAGNAPGYEEALRALFRGDGAVFEKQTRGWPADVRDHARWLARRAFDSGAATGGAAAAKRRG